MSDLTEQLRAYGEAAERFALLQIEGEPCMELNDRRPPAGWRWLAAAAAVLVLVGAVGLAAWPPGDGDDVAVSVEALPTDEPARPGRPSSSTRTEPLAVSGVISNGISLVAERLDGSQIVASVWLDPETLEPRTGDTTDPDPSRPGLPALVLRDRRTGVDSTLAEGAASPALSASGVLAFVSGDSAVWQPGDTWRYLGSIETIDLASKDRRRLAVAGDVYPLAWAGETLIVQELDAETGYVARVFGLLEETEVFSVDTASFKAVSPDGRFVALTTADAAELIVVIDAVSGDVVSSVSLAEYVETFVPSEEQLGVPTDQLPDLRAEDPLPVTYADSPGVWIDGSLVLQSDRGLLRFETTASGQLEPDALVDPFATDLPRGTLVQPGGLFVTGDDSESAVARYVLLVPTDRAAAVVATNAEVGEPDVPGSSLGAAVDGLVPRLVIVRCGAGAGCVEVSGSLDPISNPSR